ncbi:50S ribosomal protein L3 [endosymbiont of Euscepes postfasciatus]|uniref:50S ribosomal protein L3 n=1 Tax=endosymbiont of Euscepes postfasciatus TaxID=650377 RepID=UPI000DC736FD|nr:50S ribosomal protein L3 [endosymbiont of Euscepes postfasciatus]BBA84693.1 50S ribosomal protein L3 [endosymbiont of Euscepes postfasciatus]
MIYMIGFKCGMTRFFLESGSIPITVIKIFDNRIISIDNINNNRSIIKITSGVKLKKKFNKPFLGIFNKKKITPSSIIKSFIIDNDYLKNNIKDNLFIKLDYFLNFSKVNITGISKGKGFSGVIKRWNFKSQDASHGNSLSHRASGSIGQNQSPGRVHKGKKMAGHYGCDKITIKNIKIFKIDINNKLLFVKGSIPGYNNNNVYIKFVC